MSEEKEYTVPTAWSEPATATPLADLRALKAKFDAKCPGIPIGSPEAWPGLVELLDAAGQRSGIVVRMNHGDPMSGMKVRPEYPNEG